MKPNQSIKASLYLSVKRGISVRPWQIKTLSRFGALLIAGALVVFGWLIWLEWGSGLVADSQQDQSVSQVRKQLDKQEDPVIVADRAEATASPYQQVNPSNPPTDQFDFQPGETFGIITIARFGDDFEAPLLESTDTDTLTRGVGHYTDTAAPCAIGNFSLAGHRTTYGRPFYDIDRLQPGDEIVVETLSGSCRYRVDSHKIVDPSAVSVLAPVPNHPGVKPTAAWLTMTACHPKHSDSKRYVVFAKLIQAN